MQEKHLPGIVAGMSKADLKEFTDWLKECCGIDFETATADQLKRAAEIWQNDCYNLSVQDQPPD